MSISCKKLVQYIYHNEFHRLFDGGVSIVSSKSKSAFLFVPRPRPNASATLGRSPGAGVPSCEGVLSAMVNIRENPGFGAGDRMLKDLDYSHSHSTTIAVEEQEQS